MAASALKRLRKAKGLTLDALAEKTGLSSGYLSRVERGAREFGNRARRIVAGVLQCDEALLRPPPADPMETAQPYEPMPLPTMEKDLPVYAGIKGGMDGEIIDLSHPVDYALRPPSLRGLPEAAGVLVTGSSMEPRYMPGEIVICHPRKPLTKGCFVVLAFTDQTGVVKQWGSRDDRLVRVQQLNPRKTLTYPRDKVADVYRIIRGGEE